MRNAVRIAQKPGLSRLIAGALVLAALLIGSDAAARDTRYVCVPCGLPCDSKFFDKPGKCPACGMALVTEDEAKAALAAAPPVKKVAILIFDGVEIIDYTGPYEIFGSAGFDVYTVALTKDPVTTAMGMTVVPRYSFDDAPLPDVLVVPGGGVKGTQTSAPTLAWIKEETAKIQHTMSVCNGAFILASAGMLDGLSATTTNGNLARLKKEFPKINVVDDKRYVDNGKIITAAGLSAGIDGALHVVELLMGKGTAEQTALDEEYDWHGNSRFVRASLADRYLPNLYLSPEFGDWDLVSTEGTTDHWKLALRGKSDKTAAELMSHFDQKFESDRLWSKREGWKDGKSSWTMKTKDGRTWNGIVTVQAVPGKGHAFSVVVTIEKAG